MKVVFEKMQFNVKKEKGTVICVATARISFKSCQGSVNIIDPNCTKSFKVVVTSKCHKDDKFDEKKGRRIAESRAKRAVYSEALVRLSKIQKKAKTFSEEIDLAVSNLKYFNTTEKSHTNLVMDGKEEVR